MTEVYKYISEGFSGFVIQFMSGSLSFHTNLVKSHYSIFLSAIQKIKNEIK